MTKWSSDDVHEWLLKDFYWWEEKEKEKLN